MQKINELDNGDKYEGGLKNKLKHGYGCYRWTNGDVYTGDWLEDKQNGHGIYQFNNLSRYEGEFKDGEFTGEGKLITKAKNEDDMLEYEGSWQYSLPHGKGRAIYKNGDRYEGMFDHGVRNGYGIYDFNTYFRY